MAVIDRFHCTTVILACPLSCRPKRTDMGGSRLLHRAILGLAPMSKPRGKASSRGEGGTARIGEKVIILPASVLEEHSPKKIFFAKKQSKSSGEFFPLSEPPLIWTPENEAIPVLRPLQNVPMYMCSDWSQWWLD